MPPLPNEPPTPEFAGAYYKVYGKVLPVDECARMRFYRHLVVPVLARPSRREGEAGRAGVVDALGSAGDPHRGARRVGRGRRRAARRGRSRPTRSRSSCSGSWAVSLLPRRLALFGVALLAYQTLVAMGFAGATRYRVPWDFLIALVSGGGDVVGSRSATEAVSA